MLKKIISIMLVMALTATVAIGGTLAYLTDRDSEANVFTVGNVEIDLNEDFEQGSTLIPGVDIEKKPTVTNVGPNDAWVWVEIAIPAALDDPDPSKNVIHFNYDKDSVAEGKWNWKNAEDAWNVAKDVEINGVKHNVYTVLYQTPLAPNATTEAVMTKVYMDTNVDIDPNGDWYIVEDGNATAIDWNSNDDGAPVIYVSAYAMQTEGFTTVQAAYDAYQTQWGDNGTEYGTPATLVSTAEELIAALAAGENVLMTNKIEMEAATPAPYGNKYGIKLDGNTLDGGKNELYIECYGDDYGIMTSGGTIKNLTIEEGCRAVYIMYPTEDVILDNVKLGGDGVLYPINTGEAGDEGVDLIVTNSVIKGWTSYSLIASASFTNCTFEQGTYYNNIYGRVLKPYVNTTITNCSFVEHMNLDLSGLGADQKVTFENCTVNGKPVTIDIFTIPATDDEYDTELFTVDLPAGRTLADCVIIK